MGLRAPVALSFLVGGKSPDMVSNVGSNYNPSQPPLRGIPRARYARPRHSASRPLLCGEIGTGKWLRHQPVLTYSPPSPLRPLPLPLGALATLRLVAKGAAAPPRIAYLVVSVSRTRSELLLRRWWRIMHRFLVGWGYRVVVAVRVLRPRCPCRAPAPGVLPGAP